MSLINLIAATLVIPSLFQLLVMERIILGLPTLLAGPTAEQLVALEQTLALRSLQTRQHLFTTTA